MLQFVPRPMRIPLIAVSAAALGMWGVAIAGLAGELDDRAAAVTAAAAASLTVVSASAWLMFGVANMMRDRDKELLISGIVAEARKRAGTGGLRRVQ